MTTKLAKLVKETAAEIVSKTDDCFFETTKLQVAEKILVTFADKVAAETTPATPNTENPPAT